MIQILIQKFKNINHLIMTIPQITKIFDLDERTFKFAKNVRQFLIKLPKSDANREDGKQLIRSSGSVGANYIEANESLSKKDFILRIKICKKEAKESFYWLRLLDVGKENNQLEKERQSLAQEAFELTKIFGSIINKSK